MKRSMGIGMWQIQKKWLVCRDTLLDEPDRLFGIALCQRRKVCRLNSDSIVFVHGDALVVRPVVRVIGKPPPVVKTVFHGKVLFRIAQVPLADCRRRITKVSQFFGHGDFCV